jgi:hypothetical protein
VTWYINGAAGTTHTGVNIESATGALIIGSTKGVGSFHDGLIDDVRLYNRALNADEIKALSSVCNNPGRPAGTMLYDADHSVMQYCNGQNWTAIGK